MSANFVLTEQDIRLFLQDYPEANTLLDGVRWDSKQIDAALISCVDAFNYTTPIQNRSFYTVETFPFRYIALMWCAGYLLKSAAINQASNNLQYSADGIAVNDQDKAPIFTEMGTNMTKEAQDLMQQIKISTNIMGAYGVIGSEYNRLVRM